MRFSTKARATDRVFKEYARAETPVATADGGLPAVEKFASDLKAIDLKRAPEAVHHAMARMIQAVEKNAAVHRAGGNTNAANDDLAMARRDFVSTMDRLRGNH